MENPETDPHKHIQLTFEKSTKAIQWRNDSSFNKRSGAIRHPQGKKRKKEKKRISDFIQKLTQNGSWT